MKVLFVVLFLCFSGFHPFSAMVLANDPLTLRIYVAGESVEQYNHINTLAFNTNGTLTSTLDSPNEYGWMAPFSQRLQLRDSTLSIQWVGSDCWYDQMTWECSNGAYTNNTIGFSSAQAGSTIAVWQANHNNELSNKTYCYDIAFASRGGNDLNETIPISETLYEAQLRQLVIDLEQGSSCNSHPLVYVTSHILDVAAWNYGYTQGDIDAWMTKQKSFYVDVSQRVVNELNTQGRQIRFIDMWTPFFNDTPSTAFPSETWWLTHTNGVRMPDLNKIHRDGEQHPQRLASIFAGENVANQINMDDLRDKSTNTNGLSSLLLYLLN